jgi:hypothetical protein
MTDSPSQKKPTPDEVAETVGYVDGVLGSAGHSVDDPETRELIRKQAAGELTGDEARALFRKQQGLD